jgi:predicted MPP superfamily phosphohydrolase
LRAPTFVTFGNHDYTPFDAFPVSENVLAQQLEPALTRRGMIVLRNRSIAIERSGARLWIVGLEDLYTDRFLPNIAFAGLDLDQPSICMSHNPDGTDRLLNYKPNLILSGHTHGGQIRIPGYGALLLPVQDRRRDQGLFELPGGASLYVSRGVGFLAKIRFNCRPEIPLFVLRST